MAPKVDVKERTKPLESLKQADDGPVPAVLRDIGHGLLPLTPEVNKQTPAVGQRVTRPDSRPHVLGKTGYIDDMTFPDMLYTKILRSEYAHAKILSIDVSEAEKMPGVVATLTGKEIPVVTFGPSYQDQPLLADDKVRHMGDGVVAVAAETEQQAQDALAKIKVEYEPLETVLDPLEAMKDSAPKIHGDSNIYATKTIKKGDVDQALADADYVVEGQFKTQMVEHVPLEPHASIALWEPTGDLHVYSSLGRITLGRADIARTLDMPMNRIRVTATIVGGNFGGKNEITLEPILALLAKKTGRPVKGVFTREDEFISSTTRHPFVMDYTTGVTKDGIIVARKVRIVCDGGAYCSWSETTLGKGAILSVGPYNSDNIKVEASAVYTTKTTTGAMRGFGAPQVCFAYESHMDDIARELGIEPLEIRLKNAFHEGSDSPTGQVLESVVVKESLEIAAEKFGWQEGKGKTNSNKRRGQGIACMWYPIGFTVLANSSAAVVKVNEDGTATVLTGTVETGQGSLTVLGQIAAEELGIAADDIKVVSADTDTTPMDTGAIASRTTYVTGNAILLAAKKAKMILFDTAAPMLGVKPEQLEARDRKIQVKNFPQKALSIGDVALQAQFVNGQPALGSASFNPHTVAMDPETGQGKPFGTYVYATQIAEVDVDEETGEVEVLRIVAAHDCGTPINPALVEGQVEGGISMGVGLALYEEMLFDDNGKQINPNLTNYIMPTSLDMPEVEVHIVDSYDPTGPFGAKGVGEPTSVPTAACIMNAIYDAVGVRITSLPATAEKVLKAIQERDQAQPKQIAS